MQISENCWRFQMIGIINYGVGNIRSIQNMLDHLGIYSEIVNEPINLDMYEK